MRLAELIVGVRKVALCGLAKNTGKTETLNAILRELYATAQVPAVTSIGRDGEERDVINRDIRKPRIYLGPASYVATTDSLLRKGAVAHRIMLDTACDTPLGRVVIAKMLEGGLVEIAGPSAAEDVRTVCDTMLDIGADCVLIDGAINRKAASSPMVADGVVVATGAVLDADVQTVVRRTRSAVEALRLPEVNDPKVKEIALSARTSVLIGGHGEAIALERRAILDADASRIVEAIRGRADPVYVVVKGSLCEPFVEDLLKGTGGREVVLVVRDSTRLFLSTRSVGWYARQGIRMEVLHGTNLNAITVNPVAPKSHRFDSRRFRELLQAAIPDVRLFDVMDASYAI